MTTIRDMTKGDPGKHIIAFALPLLVGNVFQQLYSIVDTAIVGKIIGVNALAAVGSAGWLDWLVLGFILGLTQGFSILISQRFGAGDISGMKKAAAMSILLTLFCIIVVTSVSVLLCGTVLKIMNTPAESYDMARQYLSIIFMGIPITMFYNLFAGMLRAVGNSRTPLIAMVSAALINLCFDLLFVAVFHWGVPGAAAATLCGQFVSAAICISAVLRTSHLVLSKEDFSVSLPTVGKLTRIALPIAAQNTIVSIGGVILQSIINSFGVIIMAGISAAARISGLLEMCGLSVGSAMHTYAGQNLGAGRIDRIRSGVKKALIISLSTCFFCSGAGLLFGKRMLTLFIDMSDVNAESVINCAYDFLKVICSMEFFLYSLFIFRSTLQGMGIAGHTLFSSILQVVMRSVVTYLLTLVIAEKGLYVGDTLAWVIACIYLMAVFFRKIKVLSVKQPAF